MNSNQFLVRGINKKTNKFVYGYYYTLNNKHYLKALGKKSPKILGETISILLATDTLIDIEIIKEPDRWTEKYDKDKDRIWENDKVHSNRKLMAYDSLKGESTIVYKNNTSSVLCFVMSLNKHYLESPLTDSKAKFLKVIGNVHNVIS